MRRWLATLLLVLLPFQFTWAAAAAYCQHEMTTGAPMHFGHHDHTQSGSSGTAKAKLTADAGGQVAEDPESGPSADGKLAVDDGCGICHLTCAAPLKSHVDVLFLAPRAQHGHVISSAIVELPVVPLERPNWSLTA